MDEEIRSKRLTLRPLTIGDARHFERLLGGDSASVQMMETVPDPCTEQGARKWIEEKTRPSGHVFAILRNEDQEFVGSIGFGGPLEAPVLGYWIGRPYWGQGYATEAVGLAIKMARQLGALKLEAETFANNPASGRVLEKAGFRNTGSYVRDFPTRGGPRTSCRFELKL